MSETKRYLNIMIESLEKKEKILDRILGKNEAQKKCLKDKQYSEVDWSAFELLMAEKDTCIEQINSIDEGFENLYSRIRTEVLSNKTLYREEVAKMQKIITSITDKSVKITAGEERNRQLIDTIIRDSKIEIRKSKVSLRAVSDYYKTMSNTYVTPDSAQLDKKK